MIPVRFPEMNVTLGASQEEYEPLPAHFDPVPGRITFCCRLSDAEIAEMVATRTIWLQQLTFGKSFQPILLSTLKPDLPDVAI